MTIQSRSFKRLLGIPLALALTLQGGWLPSAALAQIAPPTLTISDLPFLSTSGSSVNVLLVLDNSNSMDEAPDGSPYQAGSGSPNSKSWIARQAARNMVAKYGAKMNIGLMAYQQDKVWPAYFMAVFRKISFNPANANQYDSKMLQPFNNNTTSYFYYNKDTSSYTYLPLVVGGNAYQNQPYYYYYPNDPANNNGLWYTLQVNQTNDTPTRSACTGTGSGILAGSITCMGWGSIESGGVTSGAAPTQWQVALPVQSGAGATGWTGTDINANTVWGFLHVPVAAAASGSPQATALNTKLANPIFYPVYGSPYNNPAGTYGSDAGGWKDPARPLENAGETPMEGVLSTALTYFTSGLNASSNQTAQTCQPPLGAPGNPGNNPCTKNFVVFLTDGAPSIRTDQGSCYGSTAAQTACDNGVTGVLDTLLGNKVETYFIGFGNAVNAGTLNSYAQHGGTGSAYSATDPASLNAAFDAIFSDIVTKSSSFAPLAVSSNQVSTSTMTFQPIYKAADWSGDLLAYKFDSTGALIPQWKAASQLTAAARSNIYTYKPSTGKGIGFSWGNLDPAQQTTLGSQAMLSYIAGSPANEGTGTGQYRVRASRLGDIVNSGPVYVGKPQMPYFDSIEPSSPYSTFATGPTSVGVTRNPMVYVGANDGMLHAFNANSGTEVFTYVPSSVYTNLPLLANQSYGGGTHKFFVDGMPTVADAFINTPLGAAPSWRTILVGGLNAGGQGIYALDVTDPTKLNANSVLWEFTDKNDQDLGYTFGAPSVVKTKAGWVAIFGNGYNNTVSDGSSSASGNAVLYVVDLATGNLIKKFDTGRGYTASSPQKPNGMSTPAAVDANGDGLVEYVYAGDLQGNLWKFDLTDSLPNKWNIAFGGQPLFTAKAASGTPQPITVRPDVGWHPKGGYLVYFGTGKAFEVSDAQTPATTVNTFYGIWDQGSTTAVSGGRNSLLQQTITNEATASGNYWRLVSSNTVDWSSKLGWYIDLVTPSGSPLGAPQYSERVIADPVLNGERIVFMTVIPSTPSMDCSASGTSWLMDLCAYNGGGNTCGPVFDVNGDGGFNTADVVNSQFPAGTMPGGGVNGMPRILSAGNKDRKLTNSSSGAIQSTNESKPQVDRRQSWRDLSAQ